jgi:chondroitin 4-sulfotransferase 11
MLVNEILRFENLSRDFSAVCDKIGIKVELPHKNKSKHDHYSKYYDSASRKIVEAHYQSDLNMFRYTF